MRGNKNEKRLTIVGMLFLAILVMVGCGKNQQATTKEKRQNLKN